MSIVRLELLKKHVRADDLDDDDELLASYLESAEEAVIRDVGRSEEELKATFGKVPAPLTQAILMLAGFWYDHREAGAQGAFAELPFAVRALTLPYKRLIKDTET